MHHPTSEQLTSLIDAARCPHCATRLDLRAPEIACSGCARTYPRLGDIPILLADPKAYLASCRRRLTLLEHEVRKTVRKVEEELRGADVLPLTRARCRAVIEAIQGQMADVRTLLEPLLPAGAQEGPGHPLAEDAPVTLEYLPYLYRDWASPPEPKGENERALATVEAVIDGRALGRTMVLGAGACRLAYDLHRRHREAEIVVIDLDPILFAAARAVTRGDPVSIREANWEICEVEHGWRQWVLAAPDGPVDNDRFHFVLADGLEPPFAPGMADTVVTPWFIDQGPDDVRDLISTLHRLLRPGGVWLNLGPLRYEPEAPIALRFAREELFDLAARSGFRLDRWRTEVVPYLVSRLNGRGRMEWVLAFSATRLEAPPDPPHADSSEDGPPSWLVFGHLPIPTFPGQSVFWSAVPVFQMVVSTIDGRRTLDDVARLVAERARRSGLSMSQIRSAVRQCLAEVHPECRKRE
ncbi:MAG: class I SAM-dependent methyltransferase [Gemmatimonadetes bacterium]|nr:class I SAM-dependent methyltransferase [Gemmatimonadota bacterium]